MGVVLFAVLLAVSQELARPLTVGETFVIKSVVLKEDRRINVYLPDGYNASDGRWPVLYMPDGGLAEDFLHVAGLLQVSIANGTVRPFVLVGIENTQRRRDLTPPTASPEDRKIAPVVGGSAAFRTFIKSELIPAVEQRYRTTAERAIMGESLAALFVLETMLLEPALFETGIAFDPSLWWNRKALVTSAPAQLAGLGGKRLYIAVSRDVMNEDYTREFAKVLRTHAPASLRWEHVRMPEETHATIYHPAALRALRALFKP